MNSIFFRRLAVLLSVLASTFFLLGQGLAAEYLVKFKNQAGMRLVQNLATLPLHAQAGETPDLSIKHLHEPGSYFLVDIKKEKLVRTLASLAADKNLEWVVPNHKLYAFKSPGAEMSAVTKEQWAMVKIQAQKAWDRAENKGKKNVIIAVIDTGVDYRHKNLAANMVSGYDFRDNDNDPMDLTSAQNPGHGTHCAGIAAATDTVADGIVGMGANVSIMPIRFLGADGSGDFNAAIRSIDYAVEKGATVISASWGAKVPRSQVAPLIEAIQRADDKGVIFVAAAANDGANNDKVDMYPTNAGTPNMISVAASDVNDQKPSWSNYGRANVSLASPGHQIMSTLPGDKYGNLSGTSMATPLVSGLVAFLKAQDSSLTGAQIRSLLQTTGAKVNIETACNCRIDAFQAVNHLLSKQPWVVPAAATLPVNGTLKMTAMNAEMPLKFESSHPEIIKVDEQGTVTALAEGTANITVTDAKGVKVKSLDYNVGAKKNDNGGGGDGQCPIGDPMMCEILCGIMPDLPFCSAR